MGLIKFNYYNTFETTTSRMASSKPQLTCVIDGNDGTGKSTIVKKLKEKFPQIEFKDRDVLTKLTDVYDDDLPKELPNRETTIYIVLDCSVEGSLSRIEKRGLPKNQWETPEALFKYRNRFLRLAIRYQTYYVDTTQLTIDQVCGVVHKIISYYPSKNNILPNPDLFSDEQFNKLELLIEGNSKIIKIVDENFTLVSYKPTVYSHRQQREGVVKFTDRERQKMTKNILYLLEKHMIPHAYIYVGEKYILCKRLDIQNDIPPIEVVVKKCNVGTDKYRYYEIDKKVSRFGKKVVSGENREYPNFLVRFDYRNPNHDPNTGKPLGDECLCDDLADQFINVEQAKVLARITFTILNEHFSKMGIYFQDVCFMITTDGSQHYSEISQDCGRYKKIDEDKLESLDKDVWRAGGSSDLVFEKWHQLTGIVHDYVKKNY